MSCHITCLQYSEKSYSTFCYLSAYFMTYVSGLDLVDGVPDITMSSIPGLTMDFSFFLFFFLKHHFYVNHNLGVKYNLYIRLSLHILPFTLST